jgi:dihydrofolate reductase
MRLSITVAMTRNRVIGTKNSLPWYLPEDLKKVKALTTGHILIMGRRTFESLPHVLPNRDHYVVTRDPDYKNTSAMAQASEHVFTAGTPAGAMEMVRKRLAQDPSLPEEVFLFGGGELFQEMLPVTDRIYVTLVKEETEGDTFFPVIDPSQWKETDRQVFDKFDFVVYDRI